MNKDITSNIDEQGNVLWLSEERLSSKETPYPIYKNHPNGLGIYNFLKEHVLFMSHKRWPLALKLYHFFIKYSCWMNEGGFKGKLFKGGIMLEPVMKAHTGSVVLPLNVDLTEQKEKVVVPMDLVKEALKDASFVAGMDTCLCRDATGCTDYPHDIACLFFGDAGRTVVEHGLGVQLTYEEACARVDQAAAHGLMAQALWIEVEQLLGGIRNDHMDKFLESCFCCPCCCIALKLARNAAPEDRPQIFHPAGWTAVADQTKCIGCKKCVNGPNGCPMDAISFDEKEKIQIDQDICVGCGICKTKCNLDVIKIKQTMPMRDTLLEYFQKEYGLNTKVWDKEWVSKFQK